MSTRYWMVKQEPAAYSWKRFLQDGITAWTGVRSHEARNNLRSMRRGDLVFFYHSVTDKEVVGIARVTTEAYPDPTSKEGDWVAVDLAPYITLSRPVTLQTIKEDSLLSGMKLVRQSRLSVLSLDLQQFRRLLALAESPMPASS